MEIIKKATIIFLKTFFLMFVLPLAGLLAHNQDDIQWFKPLTVSVFLVHLITCIIVGAIVAVLGIVANNSRKVRLVTYTLLVLTVLFVLFSLYLGTLFLPPDWPRIALQKAFSIL